LMSTAENPQACVLEIDLKAQTITTADGKTQSFDIEPARKERLLNGLDDIGLTLQHEDAITQFEAQQKAAQPWLYA